LGYKAPERVHGKGDSYYKSEHWLTLRAAARKRDGGICVQPGCGRKMRTVNHIVPRPPVPWPTNLDVLRNVECLCADHDNKAHPEKGGHNRRD